MSWEETLKIRIDQLEKKVGYYQWLATCRLADLEESQRISMFLAQRLNEYEPQDSVCPDPPCRWLEIAREAVNSPRPLSILGARLAAEKEGV